MNMRNLLGWRQRPWCTADLPSNRFCIWGLRMPSMKVQDAHWTTDNHSIPFTNIYILYIIYYILYILYRTHTLYIWLWSIYSCLPYRVLSTYQVTFIGFLSRLLNIGVSQKLSRFQQGCNRSTSTLQAYIFVVHTGFMVSKYYSHIYIIYTLYIYIYTHTYLHSF